MGVTIKQIAEAAEVSRGTVDRALNHRPGVNAQVAEKIINIAQEMGYKPNNAARTLANRRYTKTIGILLCSEGNPFFDEVIAGVNSALEEMEKFGIQGIVKTIKGFDTEMQLKKIEELLEKNIAGLVITPVNSKRVAKKLQELEDNNIPIVTINTDIPGTKHLAYVGCDYIASGRVAGELIGMMSNGCKEHVVLVTGYKEVLAQGQRLRGIKEILKKNYENIEIVAVIENEDDDKKSYELLKSVLEKHKEISTVCFVSAGVQGGIDAIKEVTDNRKIKVVTYDLTNIVKENLKKGIISAAVCQEPFNQGFKGVEILGQNLLYGNCPDKPRVNTHIFIATRYNM